ncbi:MAG TPA: YwqG family protein [Terracidiphilus sp.]|jgi:uncharacterized protein YwqG
MQREEAIELIRASAVAEYWGTLINYLSPSARIILGEDAEHDSHGQLTSHFGGQPRLPENATWPYWDKREYLEVEIASLEKRIIAYTARTKDQPETIPGIRERRLTGFRNSIAKKREELALRQIPLAFLGQLSLREISAVAPLPGWPREGVLAFFYDAADQIWGFDPLDRGHCCILYYPQDVSLVAAEFPKGLTEDARFQRRSLHFAREWTLPPRLVLDNGEFALWKTSEYRDLLKRLNSDAIGETVHRVGGNPQEIQGEMQLKCQLVTHGIYCGDPNGYKDPRRVELERGALDWQLVAQFDSDETRLGWMWGDVGRVYFWARRQDIEAADFSNSWAILQCG